MDIHIDFVLPHWLYWGGLAVFPLVYMVMLRTVGRHRETVAEADARHVDEIEGDVNPGGHLERLATGNMLTRAIDRLSIFTGTFVAYWTVIAVIVYFYEVVARYVFASPTNWAHESMFLMFGMQYILAGAYAYHYDAHVRVDLFYAKAKPRNRAALDILTSFAFLIFVLGFTITGWTFFSSSMDQNQHFWASGYANEVSFTEWAVAYYPVKLTLFVGGVLLALQGLSRLIKDIEILIATRGDASSPAKPV